MLIQDPEILCKPNQCMIMKNHTQYEWHTYNNIDELPTDWLLKNVVNPQDMGQTVLPVSNIDNIPLVGIKTYRVFKCERGILQYFNNEVGFRFNTGSYFYIRFYNIEDAYNYFKYVLSQKDIFLENYYVLFNQQEQFHIGDIVTVKELYLLEFDIKFYQEMFGMKDIYFDFFKKHNVECFDTDTKLRSKRESTIIRKTGRACIPIEKGDKFQVYTVYNDAVIPAYYPDINQLRLKGIEQLPYCSVGPHNTMIPIDNIELVEAI